MSSTAGPIEPHFAATIEVEVAGSGRRFSITGTEPVSNLTILRHYTLSSGSQGDYAALHARIARDFGTRSLANGPNPAGTGRLRCQPLLRQSISPDILYGYGDPAVLRTTVDGCTAYYLIVTSNDAPNAFPILRSADLEQWELQAFAFPEGKWPRWAERRPGSADCWAPELHRLGETYLLCFSARQPDGSLAIGMATAPRPEGPFVAADRPLLSGGVIDPHLFVDHDGSCLLLWKEDSNDLWPSLLAMLIASDPALASELFPNLVDARTAALAGALWHGVKDFAPMERFFALQPLIEAATSDFSALRVRLAPIGAGGEAILNAMRTPLYAQPLDPESLSLIGERKILLVNDLDWEGHLVEGPWLTRSADFYYLFYSGNDFSTAQYGIGVAVARNVLGPFRKAEEPLLRSSVDWVGPGHASVAEGPDGVPRLFFHAFEPGKAGYKQFRALLSARLAFDSERVALLD